MTQPQTCTHWWLIEGIEGENTRKERVNGKCKLCQESRSFEASFHGHTSDGSSITWRGRKAKDEYAIEEDASDN